VPEPNTGFVAVWGGGYHSLGLKSDGTIVAWGWNVYAQGNVPAPNADFVAIAAGGNSSLGIKNGGVVPVRLLSFIAARHGSDAWIEWQVGEAVDHAGFHLYRQGLDGDRVKLTTSLLSGQSRYRFVDAAPPSTKTEYWLAELSRTGGTSWYGPASLPPSEGAAKPRPVRASPNPSRAGVDIQFSTAAAGPVSIEILDLSGRRLRRAPESSYDPGEHVWAWDGRDQTGTAVPPGLYFFVVRTGDDRQSGKIAITR
jgi:hypothetical protein